MGHEVMGNKVIDYYFTVNSPWSYMGAARLEKMAAEHGFAVNVYPTKFIEVFGQTGGLPLGKRSPERKAYRLVELGRWSKFLDLPITAEPKYFPVDDALAAHAIIAAQEKGFDALALSRETGRAQWELEQDLSHMGTIAAACAKAGIKLEELGDLDAMAAQFDNNTETAIQRGVFGYPSYLVDGEMFWGQDRLDFLESKLAG